MPPAVAVVPKATLPSLPMPSTPPSALTPQPFWAKCPMPAAATTDGGWKRNRPPLAGTGGKGDGGGTGGGGGNGKGGGDGVTALPEPQTAAPVWADAGADGAMSSPKAPAAGAPAAAAPTAVQEEVQEEPDSPVGSSPTSAPSETWSFTDGWSFWSKLFKAAAALKWLFWHCLFIGF
jgi:hypothetical protein